jgi:hypothetical protein
MTSLFIAFCAVTLFAAKTHIWLARAATQEPSTPETTTTPPDAATAPSPSPQEEAIQDHASGNAAAPQDHFPSRNGSGNHSMQPEALRLSRALGKRLKERGGVESQSTGTLTIGGEHRQVHITRRKSDAGESLEVALTGGGSGRTTFMWEAEGGVKTSDPRAVTDTERLLVERIVHDSPDYFVLAQLRGASYYTVARQVRPAEAGDDDAYTGPTWDIVSVREPALSANGDTQQPRVRLFYINTATNLIDRVITPGGEASTEVVAEVAQWEERQGERVPARIVWKSGAEVLMEYRQTSFVHTTRR